MHIARMPSTMIPLLVVLEGSLDKALVAASGKAAGGAEKIEFAIASPRAASLDTAGRGLWALDRHEREILTIAPIFELISAMRA